MNVYSLLKFFGIRAIPGWVKLLGMWGMLTTRRRVLGIFFDPVLSCNIRCRMCYFSDPSKRKEMAGRISEAEMASLKSVLMPHALKMQIGCAAEPTLYIDLERIVLMSRQAKIPYISLTTNGQLIGTGKTDLAKLVECGLNEITLSLHGTQKDVYEDLMQGAKFDVFEKTISILSEIKRAFPKFVIRVNFTVNSLNLKCLEDNNFFEIWDRCGVQPDIIQIRPVQKMGETSWTDFDLTPLKTRYNETIGNVVAQAKERNIRCMYPSLSALNAVDDEQGGVSAMFEDVAYCYVAPGSFYKSDFDPSADTFHSYHKRKGTRRKLLQAMFSGGKSRQKNSTKKLNYKVE